MNPSTCHMKYKLISEKSLRRKNKEAGDAGRGCVFQDPPLWFSIDLCRRRGFFCVSLNFFIDI